MAKGFKKAPQLAKGTGTHGGTKIKGSGTGTHGKIAVTHGKSKGK